MLPGWDSRCLEIPEKRGGYFPIIDRPFVKRYTYNSPVRDEHRSPLPSLSFLRSLFSPT